ncbi:MAG: hypothetical protein ACLQO7_06130 [Candidatus Bathyarchaeia archaeon]
MMRIRTNRKGQFSIIASLFVAVILITSVMMTYSTIRYNDPQTNPQIMSAVDETNLSLKQVLGFTVGYYGSVLQVTGNSSYAYDQSDSYLNSGLNNIVNVNPKWGTSFKVTTLSLGTNWFTNSSFSQGSLNVTYDLTGLGVYGIAYSISSELNVQVLHSPSNNQVSLTVTQDGDQPVVSLGTSSFKFYQYIDSNLTWGMVNPPSSPVVSSDGTYTISVPPQINPQSYIIQVQDSRGIMVAASSFSHYTGTLDFNATSQSGGYYVKQFDTQVDGILDQGSHSNSTIQQIPLNGKFDTLTEANAATNTQPYHPASYTLDGSTTLVSGSPSNLVSDDGAYMTFGSYLSSTTSQTLYSHQSTTSINGANYYSYSTSGATSSGLTLSASMSTSSALLGKVVYSLQGIASLPANTWTFNYRAWKDSVSTVAYDAQSSTTSSGSSSLSWSHTVGSGSNRLLVVTISTSRAGSSSSAPPTISSLPTYDNVQMTPGPSNVYTSNTNPQVHSYIYYLVNPPSGSHTIQVSLAGTSSSTYAVGGAASYSNVNTSNPIQTSNTTPNYGQTQSVSVSTTSVGQAVYASIGTYSTSSYTLTANSGPTSRWSQTGQNYKGQGVDEINPSVGSVTSSWQTGASSVGYVCLAVVINPVATAAVGKIDATILIRETSGTVRTTLATGVALSGALTTSASTLSGTYSFPAYTVVSQTDYLEIDYYTSVSTTDSTNAYLMIDNSGLLTSQQTSIGNILVPGQYTCEAELSGASNLNTWNTLLWQLDADSTVANSAAVFQLYNYASSQYPSSGNNGYFTATLGTTITQNPQTITTTPTQFRDAIGNWKMRLTVTNSAPFNINVDSSTFTSGVATYALNLEEEWTNLNMTTLLHPALCIDAGTMGSNQVAVDAWNTATSSWQTLSSGLVSGWNNMSINSYLTSGSTTFTLKFTKTGDTAQNSWPVASVLIRPESDQDLFLALNNPAATVAVELLQNGTMIWLGQNLQVTTQLIPVPPVPVKALHVNETINGKNEQVPFQIEDWGSSYTIPLGLTDNSTVFGNRQMVVFLVNTHVSAFTLWWNGSSSAVQTPLAYTDSHFGSDNPNGNFLSNGQLNLQFGVTPFTATSTLVGSGTTDKATFMQQINSQTSTYGSGIDYVIYNGVVRDVVQQEAEWSGGVNNCPNFYADIVLTLPANATYFTYQLSLMFLASTPIRTISSLCPLSLSSTINQLQTENGTSQGDPVVASGTQVFSAAQTWVHHWSEFTSGNTGAGIMYTDAFNHGLYVFDSMSPATSRGALSVNSATPTISLLPVTLNSVTFQNALDVSWSGAVVTFDTNSVPIYNGPSPGLWVLAEMPPIIDVTCGN